MRKAISSLMLAGGLLAGISGLEQKAQGQILPFPENGLVRYYNFNQGSGVVANDATGGQDLGVANTNSWVQNGKFKSAYNPSGQYYDLNYSLLDQSAVTFNFWIKKTGGWPLYGDIIGTGSGGGNFYFDTVGDGSLMFWLAPGNAPTFSYPQDQNWHMATFTLRNGKQQSYLDNVEKAGGSLNYTFSGNSIKMFGGLGGATINNILNIDEIGIWNRELSTNEISNLYNHGNGLFFNDNLRLSINEGLPINDTPQINVEVYTPALTWLSLQKANTITGNDTNWQSIINYRPSSPGTTTFSFPITESNSFFRVMQ